MSRQIPLTCDISPKDEKIVILTDRTKIIQIVSNTVSNAIKFTGQEGRVDVRFKLVDTMQTAVAEWEAESSSHAGVVYAMKEGELFTSIEVVRKYMARIPKTPDQSWMSICVADSGCGMAPTELADMFAPYTQASVGSNRAFQGTGLGLFICVSLCQQLSGFIACASTPNIGTVFHVAIPVSRSVNDITPGNDRCETPSELAVAEEDVIVMRGPIMIADDNVVNVRILLRALQNQLKTADVDIHVNTADGGDAAIVLYKKNHPGLCIIDYHMPDTDGIAATKAIRAYEMEKGLEPSYIVCYTADATDQAKELLLKSGFDDVMTKPPPKGFIANLVRRLEMVEVETNGSANEMGEEKTAYIEAMESVREAVQVARYNESVVVNVSDGDSSREIVMTASIDEENGGISWQEATSDIIDEDIGIVKHLRTKRWVLPMLNDNDRNILYDDAIQRASHHVVQQRHQDQESIEVLDIGSGTALLAMMAAKHLRDELTRSQLECVNVNVTTLEMASAMARLARETVQSNGFGNIAISTSHSCEFTGKKAHLCISELIESGFLGEGIIPTLRDAWARHLEPDAIMVPRHARIFAQVLQSPERIERYRGPRPTFEPYNSSTKMAPLRFTLTQEDNETFVAGEQGTIVPIHASALFDGDNSTLRLCEPTLVMDFDFTSPDCIPGPEGRTRTTLIHPMRSGRAHGLLFWWELDLWEGCTYSTEPGKQEWQDHWQQCLYIFPEDDKCHEEVSVGEAFDLVCRHSDYRLDFSMGGRGKAPKRPREMLRPISVISPERVLQLNDACRIQRFREAIGSALEMKGRDAPVLDVSDFSLCAILSALNNPGGLSITSIESSTGQLPIASAQMAQLGNGLPKAPEPGDCPRFQIVQARVENVTREVLGGAAAAIVAAEPYYEVLEGWHLQEALNYFYIVRSLKKKGAIADDSWSIPSFAVVRACAIECSNLAKSYSKCGDINQNVCGFDHSIVNQYGARYHRHSVALPMWQYAYNSLTEPFELARIQYDGDMTIEGNNEWKAIAFSTSGCCHGVMIWVDYGLRGKGDVSIMSTNDRAHRQLVQLLEVPSEVVAGGPAGFHCKISLGGLLNHEDHNIEMKIESYGTYRETTLE
jgi:type III protein arginine methyltransferase